MGNGAKIQRPTPSQTPRFNIQNFPGTIGNRRYYLLAALTLAIGTVPAIGEVHTEATVTNEDRMSYLDNGVIRLGVNLELGGAITYLSKSKSHTNLINSYDWGRQIQMSHYSGPVPFAPRGKQPKKEWAGLG